MGFRVLGAVAVVFTLTACETFEGMGRDLQSGGKALERAAQ
ncbi:MAG: entericidin A/B family lipoprotein [Paracoccaceae bacterium]